jgi:hypothetical protein
VVFVEELIGGEYGTTTPSEATHVVVRLKDARTLARYTRVVEAERDAFYSHPLFEEVE